MSTNATSATSGAIDPRTHTAGDPHTGQDKYEMGTENAHSRLDTKDSRSYKNAIGDAEKTEKLEKRADQANQNVDPTAAALSHGNDPSRGAIKDKELLEDDEEILRKKDEAKRQSKEAHQGHGHGH